MRLQSAQRFIAVALLATLMIPLAYWTFTQGGAYSRAQRFLSGHPAIERKIGRVQNIRVAFSAGNAGLFAVPESTAHLELIVTGERGIGFATVDLRWERGAWDVTSVTFRREGESMPVQTFPLDRPRKREMMWVASSARSPAPPPRTS